MRARRPSASLDAVPGGYVAVGEAPFHHRTCGQGRQRIGLSRPPRKHPELPGVGELERAQLVHREPAKGDMVVGGAVGDIAPPFAHHPNVQFVILGDQVELGGFPDVGVYPGSSRSSLPSAAFGLSPASTVPRGKRSGSRPLTPSLHDRESLG